MIDFIPAKFYSLIYLFVVTVLTIPISIKYLTVGNSIERYSRQNVFGTGVLALLMIFFIGLRPQSYYFVDMMNYIQTYEMMEWTPFNFNIETDNIIFDNLFSFWCSARLGITSFFFLIALIYFGCAFLGIKRLFPQSVLPAYLVFLAAFSTFSYATNGIKAGAAASIFIWAISHRDKLKICIPLMLISYGFHHSMQLPIAAFVLTQFFKNPKYYYYAWIFCFIMSLLHVDLFSNLFANLTDEQGAGYLIGDGSGSDGTKGGFRIDFILYSAVPIFFGYRMEIKKRIPVSMFYRDLIHLYICINGIWMLCMYAEFTNRIAYLSWFLYPIVIIYPFIHENLGHNKYKVFGKTILYHLAFTLFMSLIYYKGILVLFS